MRTIFSSSIVATAMVVLLGGVAGAQSRQSAPVSIRPGASIDIVLFAAANGGKVLATTDNDGTGHLDLADLVNLGKLDVVKESCADRTRVLLVAADAQMPDAGHCSRRRLGAFWPGHDAALNVKLGDGMSGGTKALVAGAAGAGALLVLKGHEGDSSPAVSTGFTPATVSSQPAQSPTTSSPDPRTFNGTYTGSMTATTNTCGFAPTTPIRGVLTVDSSGRGTWQKTHLNAGVTFNFDIVLNMNGSDAASFNASTSQPVGSRVFLVSDSVTISGKTITITQTFNSTSGSPCSVRYSGQLSRN